MHTAQVHDAGEAAKFRENIEHFFGQAPGTNQQDRQRDVPVRVHEGDIFEALRLSSVDSSRAASREQAFVDAHAQHLWVNMVYDFLDTS